MASHLGVSSWMTRTTSVQNRPQPSHLSKLRDKERGGSLWGQRLVFLVLVTPQISIPVGFAVYPPAPERSAWYKKEKALKKHGVAKQQRPSKPAPNPHSPTKQDLAL